MNGLRVNRYPAGCTPSVSIRPTAGPGRWMFTGLYFWEELTDATVPLDRQKIRYGRTKLAKRMDKAQKQGVRVQGVAASRVCLHVVCFRNSRRMRRDLNQALRLHDANTRTQGVAVLGCSPDEWPTDWGGKA